MFVQTNVLDSDDDEDIVDNPSLVDSKVGTVMFFVNFLNFCYAFLRSLSLHTYVFILFYVADGALLVPRVLFTPLRRFNKSLEIIHRSVNFFLS